MNLIGKVTDEEVSAAIRYLDPDLPDGWTSENDWAELRSRRQVKIDWVLWCILLLIGIIFCIGVSGYVPTI